MLFSRCKNNIRVFLSENFQFLEVKFSIYLNRCVFVMKTIILCKVCFHNENNNSVEVTPVFAFNPLHTN